MKRLLKSALTYAVLPFTRLELPGWGKLYRPLGMTNEMIPYWRSVGSRTIRGKLHGYRMTLDLSQWSERHTYFLGRYYELATQLFLQGVLRPGDRFVDVGANVGLISLLAAWVVSPSGTVDAFEPNPVCCQRLRSNVAANAIEHIRLHPCALGSEEGTLALSMQPGDSCMSTLCEVPFAQRGDFSQKISVPVRVGDGILLQDPSPIRAIKIDVEGFECEVLAGLRRTIERWHPFVIVEMEPGNLARGGRTVRDVADWMSSEGYLGFHLLTRRRFFSQRLLLCPVRASQDAFGDNAVWCHREAMSNVVRLTD